jgi:hypothetical protein
MLILASHMPDISGDIFPWRNKLGSTKNHNFFPAFDMVPYLQICLFASNVHVEQESLVVTSEFVYSYWLSLLGKKSINSCYYLSDAFTCISGVCLYEELMKRKLWSCVTQHSRQ